MIKDAYYEESAACQRERAEARLYTVFKVAAILSFVILGFFAVFAFSWVDIVLTGTVNEETGAVNTAARIFNFVTYFGFAALVLGAGLLLWFLKNRFNVSYDYIYVEDELRISKVFNGKKRKFLRTLKCDQMLKLGKCANESFGRTCAGMGKKQIVYLTSNKQPAENKEFYYILYSSSIEKTVYIVETRTEMIDCLVRVAGRNKWEAR